MLKLRLSGATVALAALVGRVLTYSGYTLIINDFLTQIKREVGVEFYYIIGM